MPRLVPCKACSKTPADEDELEEFDAELAIRRSLWRNEKLLPPLGERMPIRNTFEKVVQTLMIYTGFFVPLWACFQIEYHPAHLIVDYVVDLFFWVDIMLTSRTAYYNINFELVTDIKLIQGAYVKKRLLIDLLANFPLELFALAAGFSPFSDDVETRSVFNAWKLFRMLRFFRIRKLHPPLLVDVNTSGPRRLVNFFPLMTHWVACIWFYIGISGPADGLSANATFVEQPDSAGGASWLVRPNYGGIKLGRYPEPPIQAYMSSLYWASSTLMKTAYISPSTVVEKFFTCVIILMGAIMFAVFLGQVYKILDRLDEGTAQRRDKLSTFRLFCSYNQLSSAMTRKVIGYVMAEWNITRGVSTAETLKLLSPVLSGQVLYEMRKDIIEASPLLSQVSLACAKKMLSRTTVQVCLKNEYVVGADELVRELFILVKGSLQISLPAISAKKGGKAGKMAAMAGGDDRTSRMSSKKNLMQFRMLEKMGGMTGLWKPYENGMRYPFEVQAKETSTMLNLNRTALLDVMSIFDEERATIQKILEHEFELVQQALRMGGRGPKGPNSVRETFASARESSAEEQQAQEAAKVEEELELATAKSRMVEVGATLAGVQVGLSKTLDSMVQVKEQAALLRTVLETLGAKTAEPKMQSGRVKLPPIEDTKSKEETRRAHQQAAIQRNQTESTSHNDEKMEIVARRKSTHDSANASAIVL